MPQSGLTTLEPGATFLSLAEIRVVVIPVGEASDDIFQKYRSLITRHNQVDLHNVRSFYKESQKSPFKFFPWKTGHMHLKFLTEQEALKTNMTSALHNHKRVLGVIGLMNCPNVDNIAEQYQQFEQQCRAFPDAFTVRCFAFDPTDEQITQDTKAQSNFIMFPPGDGEHLENHTEVVMNDFAACMLTALEQWMLTASPAMVDLMTPIDSPEFNMGTPSPFTAEEDTAKTKRRYARLTKAMGDFSLLAGSPADAQDHYTTATDLSRATGDWAFAAGAMAGYAAAKILQAATTGEAFTPNVNSIFVDEARWSNNPSRSSTSGKETEAVGGGQDSTPKHKEQLKASPSPSSIDTPAAGDFPAAAENEQSPPIVEQQPGSTTATDQDGSQQQTVFETSQFWEVLRASEGLEDEVRALVDEAKGAVRRRGALALLIELDLMWARFLAGLHGVGARKEVSDLINGARVISETLPSIPDRILTLIDGADILGKVDSGRKQLLLMWHAVELSKQYGFPDKEAVKAARTVITPHFAAVEEKERDYAWHSIEIGRLEAALGLAIHAKDHPAVFDIASALLRQHAKRLSSRRMQALSENLLAASHQMSSVDKKRPGPGPPPLLKLIGPRVQPVGLKPVRYKQTQNDMLGRGVSTDLGRQQSAGPFLYDPFAAKRAARDRETSACNEDIEWTTGESAIVDIEVCNPTSVGIKIERLIIEAEYIDPATGLPSDISAVGSKSKWKAKPVSLNIPAYTKPVRIQLEGVPLSQGVLRLKGCRLTAFGGVSWSHYWDDDDAETAAQQQPQVQQPIIGGGGTEAPSPVVRNVVVTQALPKLEVVVQSHHSHDQKQQYTMQPPSSPSQAATEVHHIMHGLQYQTTVILKNTGTIPIANATLYNTPKSMTTLEALSNSNNKGKPVRGVSPSPPLHRSSPAPSIHGRDGGSSGSKIKILTDIDRSVLEAALPLQPGQSVEVPVKWKVDDSAVSTQHHVVVNEVAAPQDLLVEYVGEGCNDDERAGENGLNGTRPSNEVTVTNEGDGLDEPAAAVHTNNTSKSSGQLRRLVLGRRATSLVDIIVQPSVQVSQLRLRDMLFKVSSPDNDDTDEKLRPYNGLAERKVVLQVQVVNRAQCTLQVGLAKKNGVSETSTYSGGQENSSSSQYQYDCVIDPGSKGVVALVLDTLDSDDLLLANDGYGDINAAAVLKAEAVPSLSRVPSTWSLAATDAPSFTDEITAARNTAIHSGFENSKNKELSESDKLRYSIVQQLTSLYCIQYEKVGDERNGTTAIHNDDQRGIVNLPAGELFNALTPQMTYLVRPGGDVGGRLLARELPSAVENQSVEQKHAETGLAFLPLANDDDANQKSSVVPGYPVLRAAVGQALEIDLSVHLPRDEATGMDIIPKETSLMCLAVHVEGYSFEANSSENHSAALLAQEKLGDASGVIAWCGMYQGLQLNGGERSNNNHYRIALCILSPGLFKIESTLPSVHPCFVYVQ